MSKDNRYITYRFRATKEEADFIEKKFKNTGGKNKSRFFRDLIIMGYILKFNEADMKKMLSLLSNIASNFNQIAMRVNSTGTIYEADIAELKKGVQEIWRQQNCIQSMLQKLKP